MNESRFTQQTIKIFTLSTHVLLIAVTSITCNKSESVSKDSNSTELKSEQKPTESDNLQVIIDKNAPDAITRNIIKDQYGTLWFATFDGV